MQDEDTHPRLSPRIVVEPYGKPYVGSIFSTVMFAGAAWAVLVSAKRSTTAAVASKIRRDMEVVEGEIRSSGSQ